MNYDRIATQYDAQPYRQKEVDGQLVAFMAGSGRDNPTTLDIACGTGNQLLANQRAGIRALFVGLDRSGGMLRAARAKWPAGHWVQADGCHLPLPQASFDYISNQFAYHQISDKWQFFREVWRLLRPGGRFVLANIQPEWMPAWLMYHYFPSARPVDQQRYLSYETLHDMLGQIGFQHIQAEKEIIRASQPAQHFYQTVYPRDNASQLWAISDQAYQAGLDHLQQDIAKNQLVDNEVCLITIQANK